MVKPRRFPEWLKTVRKAGIGKIGNRLR